MKNGLNVPPIAVGEGQAIFPASGECLRLELVEARPFRSGSVLQVYCRPEGAEA